jgi:ceramide glucosyltransferase
MIKILLGLGLLGLFTSTIFIVLVFIGVRRFTSRRRSSSKYSPPVSLFKPLHGAEPDLEAHLESFFEQEYPSFEIIFGARVSSDPGLVAARRVAARHPQIPVKFVETGEPWYVNAKVCTMEMMERAASHDIFIISDSDVRVTPEYIREVVAPFVDQKVGAVTCLYRGVADKGSGPSLKHAE